jgi:DNA-binding winged helix-turn-helix (wHTH) protein
VIPIVKKLLIQPESTQKNAGMQLVCLSILIKSLLLPIALLYYVTLKCWFAIYTREHAIMARSVSLYRPHDAARLISMVAGGHCAAVVGLSNFGKSTLLRALATSVSISSYTQQAGRDPLFVYVDCNRMLELTIQGYYEVMLRAILESLPDNEIAVVQKIEALYRRIVEPESNFGVPLAFNDAIVELMTHTSYDVILLLDEFDEVLYGLEPRIFLNMRALKDRYNERLVYIIATIQRAMQIRENEHISEFGELFAANEVFLSPLNPDETGKLAADIFNEAHDKLEDIERDYILHMAGGHPGLTQAVAQALLSVHTNQATQQQAMSMIEQTLESNRLVRTEISKLWNQIDNQEREALVTLVSQGPDAVPIEMRRQLVQRGMIREVDSPKLFARLFTRFVQRQGTSSDGVPSGIHLDTDAGDVWVNSQRVQTLTDLEYRLLQLMYTRLDKICDKYQIVEAVWGQDYIDEVDDARIEKLISRLRAKLERDPANPRYLITVRGRGYKLTNGDSEVDED